MKEMCIKKNQKERIIEIGRQLTKISTNIHKISLHTAEHKISAFFEVG